MATGTTLVLAVPSEGVGGLQAERSAHFGRCSCFTIVEIDRGIVLSWRTVQNPVHAQGECASPVQMLADEGVDAVVVAAIDARPYRRLSDAGIRVCVDRQFPVVSEVVHAFTEGWVGTLEPECVCERCSC